MGGDTDDAGDVDVECDASGVGGMLGDDGGVRYIGSWCGAAGTDDTGGGGLGADFGGDVVGTPWPWTKDGTDTAAVPYGVVDGMGEGAGEGRE